MRTRKVLACLIWLLAVPVGALADANGRYLLGSQDVVTIRVYDLRRNTGEAYAWTALNGEFSVGADGSVSLPILGRIQAAGISPIDLAETIGQSLKKVADLAETPAASVEVTKYRPFYVTGAVQQPGKYEYQPRLTVLQAVSTAQGLIRASDFNAVQREVVTAGGDLRTLNVERISLSAKLERLDTEIAARESLEFGEALRDQAKDARVEQAMRGEQLLFDTRRNALRAEVAALQQLKESYKKEIGTLDAKSRSLDKQVDLIRRELDLVNDLVAKGLTSSPRKLAVEQSQTSYENARLDVQVATLRAQQSSAQAERDIIELQSRFRREAISDAAEARMKLQQNEERIRTAERLINNAEAQMLGGDGMSESLIARYEISRGTGPQAGTWPAQEEDMVEPGDVVRVSVGRRRGGSDDRNGMSLTQQNRRVSDSAPTGDPDAETGPKSDPAGRTRNPLSMREPQRPSPR